ncbi:hypothetical protein KL919_004845 [Ogataea angusta]|nr:hypothetical protein KL919_004845 [Ogataea angusta]
MGRLRRRVWRTGRAVCARGETRRRRAAVPLEPVRSALYEHERHHKQPVAADPLRSDLVSYKTASPPRLRGQCPKLERKIAQSHQQLVQTYAAKPHVDTAVLPAAALEQYATQLELYHARLERLHRTLSAELAAADREKKHYWLKTQRLVDALHRFEKTELNC